MNLEIEIEEMVLQGYPSADRHAIARAVERELARIFAEEGVPPSLSQRGEMAHIDAGGFEAAAEAGAEKVGAQVARSVYGGLQK